MFVIEDSFLTHYWFISAKYKRYSRLALLTFLLAFVVILLGAYTRLTNAGLSCPDWPNCYGYMTAPHTVQQLHAAMQKYPLLPVNVKKAWTEMTHRYFAGAEGILILIFSFSILLTRKAKDAKSVFISIALIILLLTQIMLGRLTVTANLKPMIVLAHLLTGLSILSFLWWAYLDFHPQDDSFIRGSATKIHTKLFPWLWIALIILILQITLGGLVSTHNAGLACVDFPFCNGQLFPPMQWNHLSQDLITIHMLHRIGALITASYIAIISVFLLFNPLLRSIATFLLALIVLQVILGILNIIWYRPIEIALAHQAIAMVLLLTLITCLVNTSWMGHRYGA